MDIILQSLVFLTPGATDPVLQSIILVLFITGFICYLDRNVLDFLYLVFVSLPMLGLMRLVWWIRLYPRLQWDRLQLFLRFRRKNTVTGGVQVSERHLKMARQLMEELQNDGGQGAARGANDSVQ